MRESRARVIAAIAAVAVGLLAALVVVYPGIRDFELRDDVYARRAVTDRVVIEGPDGQTVRSTTKEAGDSTLERALGNGGLLLVRVGVAAIAAFLTGAVVYRVLMGRYGLKAGAGELEGVTNGVAASTGALEQLARVADEHGTKLADALSTSAEALRVAAEETERNADQALAHAVDVDHEAKELRQQRR